MGQFIEIVTNDERSVMEFGESKITIRRFDSDIYDKIRKRWTTKKGFNRRTGEPQVTVDEKMVNEDLLDYIIVSWENVKHPSTAEDVPCDKDTKNSLPTSIKTRVIEMADSENTFQDDDEDEKKT